MSIHSSAGRRNRFGAPGFLPSWGVAALIAPSLVGMSLPAQAQAVTPLPAVPVATSDADAATLATTTLSPDALAAKAAATDDTAGLLSGMPGVSLGIGGGISSIPSIHGMADDRLKTLVDGVPVTSSCPNHMNPPLSGIAPTAVGKVEVMAGITPVSKGGDSIGGTISVDPPAPVFADPAQGLRTDATLSTSYRSINDALTSSVGAGVAGEAVSLGMTLSRAHALDYRDAHGEPVRATRYENYGGEGTLAVRGGSDQLVIRGGMAYTPYEGFVNQPMDMTFNMSTHVNGRYTGEFGWGTLEAELYWQQVRHQMNFLFGSPGSAPVNSGMPMLTRGQDQGYAVKAEIPLTNADTLRIGNEFHRYTLDDWWPAVASTGMGPATFQNIDNGQRNRLGTYVEWEKAWTQKWTSLLGVRNDTVLMDSGNVHGYSSSTAAGTYYAQDSAAFNALDHSRLDVNFDVTALARFEASESNTDEVGYARKSRSPNLYERYSWSTGQMASNMIGWFGDDNYYVGNVSLKPEVANTLSATATWHDADRKDWEVKVTPYYTYIENYIGVDHITSLNGHSIVTTAGAQYNMLQFNNHDAQLFGTDLSGAKVLATDTGYGDFKVKGTIGWVRGMQINTGGNMYHLIPVNGRLALEHKLDNWSNAIDVQGVADKGLVDTTRREPVTPAYALVNLHSAYTWSNVTLSAGIENLFNKQYYDPMGGVDIKDSRYYGTGARSITTPFPAVAGAGRSFDAGVTIKF